MTHANAFLLFGICNLCYDGRVVHGKSEMRCAVRGATPCYSSANMTVEASRLHFPGGFALRPLHHDTFTCVGDKETVDWNVNDMEGRNKNKTKQKTRVGHECATPVLFPRAMRLCYQVDAEVPASVSKHNSQETPTHCGRRGKPAARGPFILVLI